MHEPFGEKRFIHDLNLSGHAIYASRTDDFLLKTIICCASQRDKKRNVPRSHRRTFPWDQAYERTVQRLTVVVEPQPAYDSSTFRTCLLELFMQVMQRIYC